MITATRTSKVTWIPSSVEKVRQRGLIDEVDFRGGKTRIYMTRNRQWLLVRNGRSTLYRINYKDGVSYWKGGSSCLGEETWEHVASDVPTPLCLGYNVPLDWYPVCDCSYGTVRNGQVASFSGISYYPEEQTFNRGYGPKGSAMEIYEHGGVNAYRLESMEGQAILEAMWLVLPKLLREVDTDRPGNEAWKSRCQPALNNVLEMIEDIYGESFLDSGYELRLKDV